MSDNVNVLPDGSAFSVGSFPLPEDHWLYEENTPPPMPWRIGVANPHRKHFEKHIREAMKYAIRASTMSGKETDFDPDAMVQNALVGLLGYFTEDGLGSESWQNPDPIPPAVR